ncbi:ribosomal RNA processing protein 36 homolog [Argiope bruennichi]|uniref:rRNA biogenesis protein RRP36 n=1 Tax=Argiope bruennichi TaxID=94029 RepID=A0A8T0F5Q9_ARGBR|nr:ribosomal RNA processing protein 36 homolog [Argiope bruennichi]KAF8786536.1 Ribosomal RNA processing protein 36 like protein [Argiope bruennichi]
MAFHRANKNRPREESSKVPVPVFREVFQIKKKHHRDPRFDDLSGSFNSEEFEENYSFINDIKKREKEELEKELKTVGDNEERRKQILYLLQRMKNQEKTKKLLEQQKAEREKEREEIMEAAKSGKKPYIPKKSEIKKKKLIESYQALKKSGKLEKYLERKRKKQFSKDTKRFYK